MLCYYSLASIYIYIQTHTYICWWLLPILCWSSRSIQGNKAKQDSGAVFRTFSIIFKQFSYQSIPLKYPHKKKLLPSFHLSSNSVSRIPISRISKNGLQQLFRLMELKKNGNGGYKRPVDFSSDYQGDLMRIWHQKWKHCRMLSALFILLLRCAWYSLVWILRVLNMISCQAFGVSKFLY
jgi:hypothetical protein